jgi:hypothetical protein
LKNGFLQEVMKGRYIPRRPDDGKRGAVFLILAFRRGLSGAPIWFNKNWSLSPEQSLSIHVGNGTVPRQPSVR